MKTIIYVPDIECDSCVKRISRKFEKEEAILNKNFHEDHIEVFYNDDNISPADIVRIIQDLGFRASVHPFDRKTFSERWRHFKENKHKYQLEVKVFTYAIGIFFLLGILEYGAYILFLKDIPNFITNYGWWVLYLNISISTLAMGIWHVASYKAKVTCMVGMMIGMTIGMQSGMLLGAIIGATNGFFMGAMVGMILGTLVGAITGRGCGVMGIMEGMMAGVMGGTMGPMITVMMFSDNVLIFMPFYVAINVIIVWGLSYLLYEEVVEGRKDVIRKPVDFTTLTSIAIIVNFILLAIMLYGPKSALVSF